MQQFCPNPQIELVDIGKEIQFLVDDAVFGRKNSTADSTYVGLSLTPEGCIDFQTPRGKIPVEVAQRAKQYRLPVIALAGTIGKDAEVNYEHGIDSYASILESPCSLHDAIADAANLITNEAERIMRFIKVGQKLSV